MFCIKVLVLAALCSPVHSGIFDYLPPADVYPACLKTVSTSSAHVGPHSALVPDAIQPDCERVTSGAPGGPKTVTTAVTADCAELSGRMEEAAKSGFLGDGGEFCFRILKEIAHEKNVPIESYVPQGETSKRIFCGQIGDSSFLAQSPCAIDSTVNTTETQQFAVTARTPVKDLSSKSLRQNFGEIMRWGDE
eukprot:gnl/MRDRNA2_/MRDRNA2_94833_c0_seq1.p1 gnl/MRDRNA2_/MRDRNA2_94833_c0~~gnl/MRDRNA2_/MRDRNA2_94833_c0_seq1.p1  ORF type:complete len:192 (-),score=31.25 gnl/MRDRNA2_/MRDRNA2_94833_c0_seq1:137-712(-)